LLRRVQVENRIGCLPAAAKVGATLTKDRPQGVGRLGDSAAGFNCRAACGDQHSVNGAEASALNWNGREDNSDDAQPASPQRGWISQVPGYFVGKPVILDLSAVTLSNAAIVQLVSEFLARDIRILGLDGDDPLQLGSSN
jgi:hypothetical protein